MAKKDAVSPKAARLLRKVAAHILEEPKRYDQNQVLVFGNPGSLMWNGAEFPACGTVGCFAGWVTQLNARCPLKIQDELGYAQRLLGITKEQKLRLFESVEDGVEIGWPTKFSSAYRRAKTPAKRAQVGAARIEHFIKTGE